MDSVLGTALELAEWGFPVFPCRPDKRPATTHGFKDATTDTGAVGKAFRALFQEHGHEGLIGVPTGQLSGLSVLDIDPAGMQWAGLETYRLLTACVPTRRGGRHYWFKHRPGLRNSASKISKGVDVRAEGGYVIAWRPDVLLSGGFAPWPAWLDEILSPPVMARPRPRPERPVRDFDTSDPRRRRALEKLEAGVRAVAAAGAGTRNQTLNIRTYYLARLIGNGLSETELRKAMEIAARDCGLPEPEIQRTVNSAIGAGWRA